MTSRRVFPMVASSGLLAIWSCTVSAEQMTPRLDGDLPLSFTGSSARLQTPNLGDKDIVCSGASAQEPGVDEAWPKPIHDTQYFGSILVDELEYRSKRDATSIGWDVTAWYGGDYDRVWVKSEGDCRITSVRGTADLQVLYGRLVTPFWDFQMGIRHLQLDGRNDDRSRDFAVLGFEGLAPYWFEVESAVFIERTGHMSANLTTTYDLLITQRLILQPRLDAEASLQSDDHIGVGQGVTSVGFGARLRYEFSRSIAPYIGISEITRFGRTAQWARSDGGDQQDITFVGGIRLWL